MSENPEALVEKGLPAFQKPRRLHSWGKGAWMKTKGQLQSWLQRFWQSRSVKGAWMNAKGQLQLEAIICFAFFLGSLGLFLGEINEAGEMAGHALDSLAAKANAVQCCLAADSIYATGSGSLVFSTACSAEGSTVQGVSGNKSRKAECIAREIRLAQKGEKSFLEVAINEHYR